MARFENGLSLAGRSAKVGGACLGLSLLVLSGDPASILGLIAVVVLAIGGLAGPAGGRHSAWVRILILGFSLVAARIAGGTAAAGFVAVLLALGMLLDVQTKEVLLGLAVFGGIVVALGGGRGWLLLAFWAMGLILDALRTVPGAAWRGLRRLRPSQC